MAGPSISFPDEYLKVLKCDFPLQPSPSGHEAQVAAHIKQWLQDTELVPGEIVPKFVQKSRIAWLAAHLCPEAKIRRIFLIGDLLSWIAVLDSRNDGFSTDAVKRVYKACVSVLLRQGEVSILDKQINVPGTGPIFYALNDLCKRLECRATPSWLAKFYFHLSDYFDSCVAERSGEIGTNPSISAYRGLRRSTIALRPLLSLVHLCGNFTIPLPIMNSPEYIGIETNLLDSIWAMNDVLAWQKDLEGPTSSDASFNYVSILAKERGLRFNEAAVRVALMHTEQQAQLVEQEAEMLKHLQEASWPEVSRLVAAYKQIIKAFLDWHLSSMSTKAKKPRKARPALQHSRSMVGIPRLGLSYRPNALRNLRQPASSNFLLRPQSDSSICIIGGGASGIAAAYKLIRRGYTNVTILEKRACVGGKATTLTGSEDGRPVIAVESGAYLVFTGTALDKISSRLGMKKQPSLPLKWLDPATLEQGYLHQPKRPSTASQRLLELGVLIKELEKYPELRTPGFSTADKYTQLGISYSRWVDMKGLQYLRDVLSPFFHLSLSYGTEDDDVPALYMFKMLFVLAESSRDQLENCQFATFPAGGFQELWRKMIDECNIRVISDCEVTKVDRSNPNMCKVFANTKEGGLEFEFDYIFVTTPLDDSLNFMDASEIEQKIFKRIQHVGVHYMVVQASGLPTGGIFNLTDALGQRSYKGITTLQHISANLYSVTSYARPSIADMEEDRKEVILRKLEALGGKDVKEVWSGSWDYHCPHFAKEDLEDGCYKKLEQLQGERRTYFLGEVLAGTSVDLTVEYAVNLVRKFFPRYASPFSASSSRAQSVAGTTSTSLGNILRGSESTYSIYGSEILGADRPSPSSSRFNSVSKGTPISTRSGSSFSEPEKPKKAKNVSHRSFFDWLKPKPQS